MKNADLIQPKTKQSLNKNRLFTFVSRKRCFISAWARRENHREQRRECFPENPNVFLGNCNFAALVFVSVFVLGDCRRDDNAVFSQRSRQGELGNYRCQNLPWFVPNWQRASGVRWGAGEPESCWSFSLVSRVRNDLCYFLPLTSFLRNANQFDLVFVPHLLTLFASSQNRSDTWWPRVSASNVDHFHSFHFFIFLFLLCTINFGLK